jgi:hypothetical protein
MQNEVVKKKRSWLSENGPLWLGVGAIVVASIPLAVVCSMGLVTIAAYAFRQAGVIAVILTWSEIFWLSIASMAIRLMFFSV